MKIKVVTSNNRGFLKGLFDYPMEDARFEYNTSTIYEKKSGGKKFTNLLRRINGLKICDFLGVFQIIHSENHLCDMEFSYNRFVHGSRPYVIYLENPGALLNYNWRRSEHLLTKARLSKEFNNPNLKAIICMSQSCMDGLYKSYSIPTSLHVETIYPLIKDRKDLDANVILSRQENSVIECLFVAEYFRRKGGKDVLKLFERIEKENLPFHLKIVTGVEYLDDDDKAVIRRNKHVDVHDFTFSKEEMMQLYYDTDILLNPTRWDSFSLVTLEAIKAGCLIIGTNVYAIKEMVPKQLSHYLHDPYFKYWNDDNTININIALRVKQTLENTFVDDILVEFMYTKLKEISLNRKLLCDARLITLNYSVSSVFGEN